ncbi:glucokinase (macronuclear) [Tetrahymena thermophila SB210]|uniref:Glucokinase n=1 Tax=Tetrahymena thermophila (strain SB210) TaxID=312017 RepID=Q23RE9_TETTS|nr:glucokinase [Tetrahymena thermophila SB210]EAR99099.2 glucokinase [Tetrahymena thermophila SB210]|eukprot:XP_001019344.2 glucokinase [Tetrahymena thermophila SB210]
MLTALSKILNQHQSEYKPSTNKLSQTGEIIYKALIGDIGGTNIRLRLISFTKHARIPTVIKSSENMKTNQFNSFTDAIAKFLEGVEEIDWPEFAGIGMAGAVLDNQNTLTNAPHWPKIIGNELAQQFKIKKFQLFNDFEVASYACLNLTKEEVIQINTAQEIPNKIKTVCGAGTGLGVANIIPYPKYPESSEYVYQVWPGEGGHGSFAPITKTQQEFVDFLLKYFPERTQIALEYAFVGPAIPYMYAFFKNRHQGSELALEKAEGAHHSFDVDEYHRMKRSKDEKEREKANFPSHLIFEYGVQAKDAICEEVVKFFVSIYETAIGDMAVRNLPYSGIYLVGSMSLAVLPYIQKNQATFMKEYYDNRPYLKDVFDKIPIYIVKEKDIGLDGAYVVTRQMVQSYLSSIPAQ